jgi:hypothetical protein
MLGNRSQGPEPFQRDRQSADEDQPVSQAESPRRAIDVRRGVQEQSPYSDNVSLQITTVGLVPVSVKGADAAFATANRDGRIRTGDLLLPRQADYQTFLHPV